MKVNKENLNWTVLLWQSAITGDPLQLVFYPVQIYYTRLFTVDTVVYRAAALTSQNHMTNYFRKAKEHGVQWQLNGSYRLTCTSSRVAAQFNQHGNCATVTVDTVVFGKFQAACVSKITVELILSCLAVL